MVDFLVCILDQASVSLNFKSAVLNLKKKFSGEIIILCKIILQ